MKYIIKFKKTGKICYTSHLDIMKVFKRSFKRAGIRLKYSKGFNPHPKMGFAQPLSLGYEGMAEYIEFERAENFPEVDDMNEELLKPLANIMPEGLELTGICRGDWLKKTLAAETVFAEYTVKIPAKTLDARAQEMAQSYMAKDVIETYKKQKKKPEPVLVNIRPKIRKLSAAAEDDKIILKMKLDQGSESNLSPELVINTFVKMFNLNVERCDIEVRRDKIGFTQDIDKYFQL